MLITVKVLRNVTNHQQALPGLHPVGGQALGPRRHFRRLVRGAVK